MRVQTFFWWTVFPFVVFFFVLTVLVTVCHGHGEYDWIMKYTGKGKIPCCGIQDCIRVRLRIVGETDTTYDFEMNEHVVVRNFPKNGYHPSEDGDDWWCFFPQGSFDPAAPSASPENDACVQNPTAECSNCFFIAPKM